MPDIILDLGEYGEILVEIQEVGMGWAPAGIGERIKVSFEQALKLPLTGIGKVLMASLPEEEGQSIYRLEEFSFEFEVGLSGEYGSDLPIVAKIMPAGTFRCTYTWKRK